MSKFAILVLFVLCLGISSTIYAQNVQTRTDSLVAALGKTKYKKKEKKNVSIEIYVDIKNEAVVKNNIREYAGVYESEFDYRLELRVSEDGKIEGSGYDTQFNNSQKQNFTLKNARIEGALLTATKVFANGATEDFEAVFVNRTVQTGKNPSQIENRETKFGLGFIQSGANWTNRVFLESK